MKPHTTFIILLICLSFAPARAQIGNNDDYFNDEYLRAEDYIYQSNIKTVQLYRNGFVLSAPIINLNAGEQLVLSFDDLNAGYQSYKYTLIHCDAYWTPSAGLRQNEYLSPFTEDDIIDFKVSVNTLQKYTHYSLIFPTSNMQPSLSGNYILKVYAADDPSKVAFTRRLMIVDNKLMITASMSAPTKAEYRFYRQEIDFSINKTGYNITDPYKNLKIIIQQNGRWDNAIINLKPLFVKGDILDYNYEEENVFTGGNEFRRFDIKSLTFYSEFIGKITKGERGYEVFLKDDLKRAFKVYQSDKDINGKAFIKSDDNVSDSDVECEYVHVHFFLKCDSPLTDGGLYVFGAITDWNFSKNAQMVYNFDRRGYEAELYIKQGYYNYEYVFLPNGQQTGDETLIEGSHFDTDNEYTIYIYNREAGYDYDVLIGLCQFNSFPKKQ